MKDVKEIRRQLWYSLDMAYVKLYLFVAAVSTLIMWVFFWLTIQRDPYHTTEQVVMFWVTIAIVIGPILVFCLIRTFNIFRHAESYHFCKTVLCNPKGGSIRDTIKFTVLIEDADGDKFAADTHSIFLTHTSMFGLALEDYVNRTVTAGYNEETGQVIIIG